MSILKIRVSSEDHQLRNDNALITLVEYVDYQCPHCKRAYPFVKRLLTEKGKDINFVFRNFPLRKIHPYAYLAATTAEAAGKQNKFWEMHDLIFENQKKITPNYLLSLAKSLNLDLLQFDTDSKSDSVKNKVEADFIGGIRSGVNRTPSFFLNGKLITTYDGSYESLSDAIQVESAIVKS